jgi:hypothetical protein
MIAVWPVRASEPAMPLCSLDGKSMSAAAAATRFEANEEPVRRVSIALGASTLIHVILLALLGGIFQAWPRTSPQGIGSTLVLHAFLQGPDTPVQVEPPPVMTVVPETPKEPLLPPPATARPAPQAPTGDYGSWREPSENATPGAPDPPVLITSRTLQDASKLGASYAEALARQFPDRVQREPQLRSPLVVLYPRAGIDKRMSARIAAQLTINENGEIVERRLIPDEPVFGPAVAEALAGVRFSPAEIEGKAVPYYVIIEFAFAINPRRRGASP